MNVGGAFLWGFVATIVLTTIMSGAQLFGLSRMSIPFLLGTMFTPDRPRARVLGSVAHVVNGWIFAFVYAFAFESWGHATVWHGLAIAFVHVAFVLIVAMPLLPGMHPRMASEERGPEPTRQLQPPGVLALNYGHATPIAAVIAHLVYGAILGGFYRLAG
jgi:hypothetical protein